MFFSEFSINRFFASVLPFPQSFRAAAVVGEYVSTYFLVTSKGCFFSGFSYLAWYAFSHRTYMYTCILHKSVLMM